MTTKDIVRVTSVVPVRDFVLRLSFSDGAEGELDLEPILWGPVFEPLLRDPVLFRQVRVDPQLGTIVWPNEADMDPVVLHARVIGTYEELMRGEAASG